ncbi:hypothetical protein CUMW_283740 [Citrus unshiu]|uniref:Uncharacterized protein n=1 Tax=Citrus unshiu TaxID=55188 RepID=A0A2H5MVA1_CITUN|nr:hypothetical protein CUMW_283740 [Citrus unshiu]
MATGLRRVKIKICSARQRKQHTWGWLKERSMNLNEAERRDLIRHKVEQWSWKLVDEKLEWRASLWQRLPRQRSYGYGS